MRRWVVAFFGRLVTAAWAASALALLMAAGQAAAGDADLSRPAASWLTPALTYDGVALANLQGGARTGSTYVGNLHLKLTAKGDAFGWPGTSAFVDVLTIHGGLPSRFVGDVQGVSNLEGPPGTQVEELWLQHNFKSSSASLLAGIYDLNSEFYRLQSAALFLNGAFGIGPEFAHSGVEGPSIFPRTSAGLRFAFKPMPDTVLRMAFLDGVPVVRPDGSHGAFRSGDGLLTVAEFAMLSRTAASPDHQESMRDRIGRFSSLAPYQNKGRMALLGSLSGPWRHRRIGQPAVAPRDLGLLPGRRAPADRRRPTIGQAPGRFRAGGRGRSEDEPDRFVCRRRHRRVGMEPAEGFR